VLLPGLGLRWVGVSLARRSGWAAVSGLTASLLESLRRRATGMALVALHLVGLVIVAAMIFGDTRLRTPYDPFILLLAVEAYATAGWLLWRLVLRLLRKTGVDSATQPEVSPKPRE
jgi:hypothetical protein